MWRAFGNRYWPAVYIADAEGWIRQHHLGEGEYDDCEWAIQMLLREAGAEGIGDDLVPIQPDGVEAQADWANLRSPETYLGYAQGRNFASREGVASDEPRTVADPAGQYYERGFQVLSAGPTPRTPLEEWTFSIQGASTRRARGRGTSSRRCRRRM